MYYVYVLLSDLDNRTIAGCIRAKRGPLELSFLTGHKEKGDQGLIHAIC